MMKHQDQLISKQEQTTNTTPVNAQQASIQKPHQEHQPARQDLNTADTNRNRVPDMNEGEEHLAATGAGTLGGAAVGATLGAVGGPPGAVVGGVIGGVVGGLAGNDIATKDTTDTNTWDQEEAYWRNRYEHTPYYQDSRQIYNDLAYDRDYRDAYRLGYEQRLRVQPDTQFDDVEKDLATEWEQLKGESRLGWEQAKLAVKDAWNRLTR